MKTILALLLVVALSCGIALADAPPAPAPPITPAGLEGIWDGIIGGPGNRIVIRIAGNSGHYTATTDSIDQGLVALPTGVAMDAQNNVRIKIAEPSPLTFVGTLIGDKMTGTWSEDVHSGPLNFVRAVPPANSTAGAVEPKLAGTWEGVRVGYAFHYVFHITGSLRTFHAIADSPDQNANGLPAAVKIDDQNNVFMSIGFMPAFYFTGYLDGDTISGTFTQAGEIGEMSFTRKP